MDNINFKKVLDDGELFNQQANYEDNFEKINQLVVPKITDLETNKVDKVAGKGLSTNDFDNTYKQKIDVDIPAQLNEIGNKPVHIDSIQFAKISNNMFNKDTTKTGFNLNYNNGLPSIAVSYSVSDFIEVEPNTNYILKYGGFSGAWYDSSYNYISATTSTTITSPSNAKYFRMGVLTTNVPTQQMNRGTILLPYDECYVDLEQSFQSRLTLDHQIKYKKRIYSLSDAVAHWKNGEKFPIAFFGDSTTDGNTLTNSTLNTIGTDHIEPNAYPYLLEQKLKAYTGNNNLRIYNAGFSGWNTVIAYNNIDDVFKNNVHYNDVKMVGIMFGINDRAITNDVFKNNLKKLIAWFYINGIQPFLITPQVILQEHIDANPVQSAYWLGTSTVKAIKDIADTFNIEVLDNHQSTNNFLANSKTITTSVIADNLHFTDLGHQYEAGFMFSKLIGDTINISNSLNVGVTNSKIKQYYDRQRVTQDLTTFQRYVGFTSTTVDKIINKVYIFNESDKQFDVSMDVSVTSNFYFKVDGISYNANQIAKLEIGMHEIETWSGLNTTGRYRGLIFTKI